MAFCGPVEEVRVNRIQEIILIALSTLQWVRRSLSMSTIASIMSTKPPIKKKYGRLRSQTLIGTSGPVNPAIMMSMTPRMNKIFAGIEMRLILIT